MMKCLSVGVHLSKTFKTTESWGCGRGRGEVGAVGGKEPSVVYETSPTS